MEKGQVNDAVLAKTVRMLNESNARYERLVYRLCAMLEVSMKSSSSGSQIYNVDFHDSPNSSINKK